MELSISSDNLYDWVWFDCVNRISWAVAYIINPTLDLIITHVKVRYVDVAANRTLWGKTISNESNIWHRTIVPSGQGQRCDSLY